MGNIVNSYNYITEDNLTLEKQDDRLLYSIINIQGAKNSLGKYKCDNVYVNVCDSVCPNVCIKIFEKGGKFDDNCIEICDSICMSICDPIW